MMGRIRSIGFDRRRRRLLVHPPSRFCQILSIRSLCTVTTIRAQLGCGLTMAIRFWFIVRVFRAHRCLSVRRQLNSGPRGAASLGLQWSMGTLHRLTANGLMRALSAISMDGNTRDPESQTPSVTGYCLDGWRRSGTDRHPRAVDGRCQCAGHARREYCAKGCCGG